MYDQAVAEIQKAVELGVGGGAGLGRMGYAYARAGKRDEALKILDQLEQRSKQSYVSPYTFAAVYAALGERDREALLMREEGLDYNEIAAALELSVASVGTTLARARRRLMEAYEALQAPKAGGAHVAS